MVKLLFEKAILLSRRFILTRLSKVCSHVRNNIVSWVAWASKTFPSEIVCFEFKERDRESDREREREHFKVGIKLCQRSCFVSSSDQHNGPWFKQKQNWVFFCFKLKCVKSKTHYLLWHWHFRFMFELIKM